MKKVSVIVNCHNGEEYLEKCLNSILKQNFQNFEIIFFDNASNDNTKNIIKKFDDNRIKYFLSEKKLTLYHARNKALQKSSGELIAFLDVDDWWEENYLSSREKFFTDPEIDFLYCNSNIFYQKKEKKKLYRNFKLPSGKIFSNLSKDYFIIISGVIFKRELFSKYGNFNKNYNILGDYDFIMKISKTCNAHATNLPLINYRIHENNFLNLHSQLFYEEYKDWYERIEKEKDIFFMENKTFLKNKLINLEILYLLKNKKKSVDIFFKILNHKIFKEKIKLLILFFLPKSFLNYIKK